MHSENISSSQKSKTVAVNNIRSIVGKTNPNTQTDPSCPLLSPGRIPLKNQVSSPSLLRSPPSRALTNPARSLLTTPTRIPHAPMKEVDSGIIRRSPRLLSKLIQGMDIKANNTECHDVQNDQHDSNPFIDQNNSKSAQEPSKNIQSFDTIISSSPQKSKNATNQPDTKSGTGMEIPLLLPTGKTPRATRSISFQAPEEEEEEIYDENNLKLSNTVELFSPGFHGEAIHHIHGAMAVSSFDSQSLVDKISEEFAEPSPCELEFYQSEEYADGIAFAASLPLVSSLPPHPFHGSIPVLPSIIVKDKVKITLVLDLDETLVHCSDEPMEPFDISFSLSIPGRTLPLEVFVRWRPHLFSFLEELKRRSDVVDVVLFTASQKIYARRVLTLMDPEGVIFSHALFRESCRFLDGSFVKDLSILGRPLSQTILVDNSIQAYALHPENGYAIPSWFDDPKDDELPRLLSFLDNLLSRIAAFPQQVDFRHILRKRFPIYNSAIALKEARSPDVPDTLENTIRVMV